MNTRVNSMAPEYRDPKTAAELGGAEFGDALDQYNKSGEPTRDNFEDIDGWHQTKNGMYNAETGEYRRNADDDALPAGPQSGGKIIYDEYSRDDAVNEFSKEAGNPIIEDDAMPIYNKVDPLEQLENKF